LDLQSFSYLRFFFFIEGRSTSTQLEQAMSIFYSVAGLTFVIFFSVFFQYRMLAAATKVGLRAVALTSARLEPWSAWYPIFCDGDDVFVQKLFSSLLLCLLLA